MADTRNLNFNTRLLIGLVIAIIALFGSLISYNTISVGQVNRELNLKADKADTAKKITVEMLISSITALTNVVSGKADKVDVAGSIGELKETVFHLKDDIIAQLVDMRGRDKELQESIKDNTKLLLDIVKNQNQARSVK